MDVVFIVGLSLFGAFVLLYAYFSVLLCKRRGDQPVKSKSPALLVLSLLGNSLSVLALCGTFSVGSFYEPNQTSDGRSVFTGLIVSEVIAMPLMALPYILRYRGTFHCRMVERHNCIGYS